MCMGFMKVIAAKAMALAAMQTKTTQYLRSPSHKARTYDCLTHPRGLTADGAMLEPRKIDNFLHLLISKMKVATNVVRVSTSRGVKFPHASWTRWTRDEMWACRTDSHDLSSISDVMIHSSLLRLRVAATRVSKGCYSNRHGG